jgi:protein required for attachment to host cells
MIKPLRTEFIIADGARARWVRRSDEADDFVTVRELFASEPQRSHPEGVVFEGHSGQRFNVEARDTVSSQRRLRFAEDLAREINAEAQAGRLERLAVIAPPRMLSAIRQRLGPSAAAMLARTLGKDLTKTPDHELGGWLRRLERG